ncbi:BTAD domain-containing putative transcriptional regulator [Amycolatopsis jiangsuensis]|uniref:Putative ATPase n=1 Tax=Amycolatopsis jiangsuensis TaxID=1181879 RepID=A0A840IVP1_9PSEU|nr:BTAD domain-containing putative transcriptional regulator [Amycolatopsis jiangsuensis]MBB4685823.1 putative ATPase [Amycolatopsis jiangsuensis]
MRIGVLGPLEVRTDAGAEVEVAGVRVRTLLSALALEPGRVVAPGRLVDAVWGAHPPATANALQALVSRLRRAGADLESTPAGYRLPAATVDVARFEELVTAARAAGDDHTRVRLLREALDLWRGPALGEVADGEFFQAPVARLTELRLTAAEDHAESALRLGHGADLTTELSELLAQHPLRERLAAALMRALHAAGQPAEALRVFARIRAALADELGADPSAELSTVHTSLLRENSGTTATGPRTNLRAGLTSFVGRDSDVAEVAKLVGEYRLTTLIGPGGAGKTRLAGETGHRLLSEANGDVWFIELASAAPGTDLAQAVLGALEQRGHVHLGLHAGGSPRDRAVAALRGRETLLVLDNCEHVIDAAAELAERLLGECPLLRVLATSREALAVTGEALWPVEPLTLPAEGAGAPEAMTCASVRLFADRAAAVRPGFTVDDSTVDDVVRVCRALDGMPLAVELAAARLRSLTVPQLAARLDDRFRLLTGGSRTALARHRTLRAVVDWSWDLLEPDERRLLRRLAVFSGGATAEAAEAVCEGGADSLLPLVDKSLLTVSGDPEPRYGMLETIKAYGLERLAEAGEGEAVREAHAQWFASLAERADGHLRAIEQLDWLPRLKADHGNLVAAIRSAIAAGDAALSVRLVVSCSWFWLLTGHKLEGLDLIAAALAVPGRVDDGARATAYAMRALLMTAGLADDRSADDWVDAALELAGGRVARQHPILRFMVPSHELLRSGRDGTPPTLSALDDLVVDPDPWLRAHALLNRSRLQVSVHRDVAAAEEDGRESVRLFRLSGERWGASLALSGLAELVARRGALAESAALYGESVDAVRELGALEDAIWARGRQAQLLLHLGDEAGAAAAIAAADLESATVTFPDALAGLAHAKGDLARWQGDPATARLNLERAEALLGHTTMHPVFRAMLEHSHAYLDAGAGDLDSARVRRRRALDLFLEVNDVVYLAQSLVGVADHAVRLGRITDAALLLRAATDLRGGPDHGSPDTAAVEASIRGLGEHAPAEAPVADAIALAHEVLSESGSARTADVPTGTRRG